MATAATATAFVGLLVSTGAIGLVSYFDDLLGALSSARDLPLHVAVKVVMAVAAVGALNAAVAFIHVRICNGRAAAARRSTLDVVCFIMCASISVLLQLIFFLQPGAMDGAQDLLPLAVAVAVVRALLPAAALVTYFLSVVLIYVHIRTGGAGGVTDAGNGNITTSAKLLTKMTLPAALFTVVLSLIAAIVILYSE